MTIRPIARRSIPAAIRVAVATVALLSFLGLLAVIVRSNVLAGRESRLAAQPKPPGSPAYTWDIGDVFLGVGGGSYQVRTPDGGLIDAVYDGLGGLTTGCAFSSNGDLYTTDIDNNAVEVYQGTDPHSLTPFGVDPHHPFSRPEMVVFDARGNTYVSNVGQQGIYMYDPEGNWVRTILTDTRVDYFDIEANQDTILYTQELSESVLKKLGTGLLQGLASCLPLRAAPLGPVPRQALRHQVDSRHLDHRLARRGQDFVVFA